MKLFFKNKLIYISTTNFDKRCEWLGDCANYIHIDMFSESAYSIFTSQYLKKFLTNTMRPSAMQAPKIRLLLLSTLVLLTEDEIIKACLFSRDSGADFVKTSTGFSKYGAKETGQTCHERWLYKGGRYYT